MSSRGGRPHPYQQQYVRGGGGQAIPVIPMAHGGGVPMIRGPLPHPGTQIVVQAAPPPQVGPPLAVVQQLEQKLAVQHAEFQQLLTENQRLAATHVALRQELAAAQGELQRLKQILAQKDGDLRQLAEKNAKMEAELRATDTTRHELQAARQELQSVVGRRQELEAARAAQATQMQQMQGDMQRMRADLQQIPALRQDVEGLQQEVARTRQLLDVEKKSNVGLVEQRTAMEKNLVAMARDVERLKAELANVPKTPAAVNSPASGYGGYGASPGGYGGSYGYSDGYSASPGAQAYAAPVYMGYSPGAGAGAGPGAGGLGAGVGPSTYTYSLPGGAGVSGTPTGKSQGGLYGSK